MHIKVWDSESIRPVLRSWLVLEPFWRMALWMSAAWNLSSLGDKLSQWQGLMGLSQAGGRNSCASLFSKSGVSGSVGALHHSRWQCGKEPQMRILSSEGTTSWGSDWILFVHPDVVLDPTSVACWEGHISVGFLAASHSHSGFRWSTCFRWPWPQLLWLAACSDFTDVVRCAFSMMLGITDKLKIPKNFSATLPVWVLHFYIAREPRYSISTCRWRVEQNLRCLRICLRAPVIAIAKQSAFMAPNARKVSRASPASQKGGDRKSGNRSPCLILRWTIKLEIWFCMILHFCVAVAALHCYIWTQVALLTLL